MTVPWRHRLRSSLTVLGIVIGISSVILTVGLGQGAQQEVEDQIDALGSNLLIVSPGSSTDSSGMRGGFGSASTLTYADAAAIADPAERATRKKGRPAVPQRPPDEQWCRGRPTAPVPRRSRWPHGELVGTAPGEKPAA